MDCNCISGQPPGLHSVRGEVYESSVNKISAWKAWLKICFYEENNRAERNTHTNCLHLQNTSLSYQEQILLLMCCFPVKTLPNLRQTRDFQISLFTAKNPYLHFSLNKSKYAHSGHINKTKGKYTISPSTYQNALLSLIFWKWITKQSKNRECFSTWRCGEEQASVGVQFSDGTASERPGFGS